MPYLGDRFSALQPALFKVNVLHDATEEPRARVNNNNNNNKACNLI